MPPAAIVSINVGDIIALRDIEGFMPAVMTVESKWKPDKAKEAENMNEDDPRQAANLMRKLTDMTGLELGPGMQEALKRMEAGEDPDAIEAEMGDLLEEEEPFALADKKGVARGQKRAAPIRDETLYDL